MHIAISFKTSLFDLSKEHENMINPIYGESFLMWFKDQVNENIILSEPQPEDWGWYSYLSWKNRQYMIGASVCFEEGDDPQSELEWVIQIDKTRSFIEKVFGKEKINTSDDCVLFVMSKLAAEPQFNSVSFEQ